MENGSMSDSDEATWDVFKADFEVEERTVRAQIEAWRRQLRDAVVESGALLPQGAQAQEAPAEARAAPEEKAQG